MNAAEITDKLGLHSLRQRAWVRTAFTASKHHLIHPVHSIHLCYIRRWSLRRFGVACKLPPKGWSSVNLASSITPQSDCVSSAFPHNNRTQRPYSQPLLHIDHWCSHLLQTFLSLQAVHFHKRRKGGYCTMNQARPVFLGCCIRNVFSYGYLQGSFFSFLNCTRVFWPRGRTSFPTSGLAILCFSMV